MTQAPADAITMPTDREHNFAPPGQLEQIRSAGPITRLAFPDGHIGWLVTSHTLGRQILADNRFSARQELRHSPAPLSFADELSGPTRPGHFNRMDPPDHTRYRRLLTAQFTVRRMNLLIPRIEEAVEEHLDAMEEHGPPVDLVESFALPIPSILICELLGVPVSDRAEFIRHTAIALSLETSSKDAAATLAWGDQYLRDLVRSKRENPTDDMFSDLINSGELTDEELYGIVFPFLGAHETTSSMLSLGTFALLENPSELAKLRANPALIDGAVEELLRYTSILNFGLTRAALEDVEIAGEQIGKGEAVVISVPAANWDPERFEAPETLDITRTTNSHLMFGHGVHQCLGQHLARVEMRVGYVALFRRFPTLRLSVPPEQVAMRVNMAVHGVKSLLVEW
ncbi:cytochrome P450 [Nonomuraea sp. NPDC002799]